jgi:hypothetical protein
MRHSRRSLPTLLAVCALALPVAATGQAALGLNAGVTFATLSGDDVPDNDTDMRTGLLGGASLSFQVGDIFAIAPGVYYAQKGTKLQTTFGSVNVDATLKLDYIEVPILGIFTVTGADRPLGINLFLGPSIAFEISCKVKAEAAGFADSSDCDDGDELAGERKKLDLGAIFGAGLAFPLSSGLALTLNGGLDMGLMSLDDSAEENDVKNSVWFLLAGVRIPLGG